MGSPIFTKVPIWRNPQPCPKCESLNVFMMSPNGDNLVAMCTDCGHRWGLSTAWAYGDFGCYPTPQMATTRAGLVDLIGYDSDSIEPVAIHGKRHVWVRCVSYHTDLPENAIYRDDEYAHGFTVQVFDEDPGEYSHSGGTPDQFRVRVEIDNLPPGGEGA